MTIQFSKIPVGARFEFRGHRYEKLALSMACDEERLGNIFHAETEVVPEADQKILPEGRAGRATAIELSHERANGPLSPALSPSAGEREQILNSMAVAGRAQDFSRPFGT